MYDKSTAMRTNNAHKQNTLSRSKVFRLENNLKETHPHTHTHLTALFPGLHGWASTRKVKPIWILLKQETVSGSGISWDICKSAPRSRLITMPAPHHSSFFTGRMPFLSPNQQCQRTENAVEFLAHNYSDHTHLPWQQFNPMIQTFKSIVGQQPQHLSNCSTL